MAFGTPSPWKSVPLYLGRETRGHRISVEFSVYSSLLFADIPPFEHKYSATLREIHVLPRHGSHRKHRFQQLLHCCVLHSSNLAMAVSLAPQSFLWANMKPVWMILLLVLFTVWMEAEMPTFGRYGMPAHSEKSPREEQHLQWFITKAQCQC
jgi:hypothetical protein